jgi:hypothetical protein
MQKGCRKQGGYREEGSEREQGRRCADEGRSRDGKRVASMSAGADRRAGPYLSEVTALPLSPSHSLVMPSAV